MNFKYRNTLIFIEKCKQFKKCMNFSKKKMETLVQFCIKNEFIVLARLHNLIRQKYISKYTSVRNMCMFYFWELLVCIAWILLYIMERLQKFYVSSASPAVPRVRVTRESRTVLFLYNLISCPTDKTGPLQYLPHRLFDRSTDCNTLLYSESVTV